MKFHIIILCAAVFSISFLEGNGLAFAAEPAQNPTDYVLLAPLPGISDNNRTVSGEGGFAGYANRLIVLIIALASLLAVLMITIGGFQYMISESVGGKDSAKDKIWNAVWGFLLLLCSYLILYTINPQLLNLNLRVEKVRQPSEPENRYGITDSSGNTENFSSSAGCVTLKLDTYSDGTRCTDSATGKTYVRTDNGNTIKDPEGNVYKYDRSSGQLVQQARVLIETEVRNPTFLSSDKDPYKESCSAKGGRVFLDYVDSNHPEKGRTQTCVSQ